MSDLREVPPVNSTRNTTGSKLREHERRIGDLEDDVDNANTTKKDLVALVNRLQDRVEDLEETVDMLIDDRPDE